MNTKLDARGPFPAQKLLEARQIMLLLQFPHLT